MADMIFGVIVILLCVFLAHKIWRLLIEPQDIKRHDVGLIVGADCGDPEIWLRPDLKNKSATVNIFLYRTVRLSSMPCRRVIISAFVPLKSVSWRAGLLKHRHENIPIQVNEHSGSRPSFFIDFEVPSEKGGVIEFTMSDVLSQVSPYRYQIDLTFGHFVPNPLPIETTQAFRKLAPKQVNVDLQAIDGFIFQSGFPEPIGGQVGRFGYLYRYSIPYSFAPIEKFSETHSDYYRQTDLSAIFENPAEIKKKSWRIFLWSSLFGIMISIASQSIVTMLKSLINQ